MRFIALVAGVFLTLLGQLDAAPSEVILIRHAEKPKTGNCLSKQGFQRAAALVPFFTLPPANSGFMTPVAIYAQCSSKNHQSTRPVQTVSPLATTLGIELITQYTFAEYPDMVKEIMANKAYDGETVLVCWSHEKLADIATAFGVKNPPSWGSVYDRIWVISFSGNTVSNFQNLPQQLMFGDSST